MAMFAEFFLKGLAFTAGSIVIVGVAYALKAIVVDIIYEIYWR